MEFSEIFNIYNNYRTRIEDLWRSLWTRKKRDKN